MCADVAHELEYAERQAALHRQSARFQELVNYAVVEVAV